MYEILLEILNESLAEIRADKLLKHSLEAAELSGRFHLIAVGKAAGAMAKAAHEHLGSRIIDGIVITPTVLAERVSDYLVIQSGHPYPDEFSLEAGRRIFNLAKELKRGDQILLLISGGASSLVEFPRENVELAELIRITCEMQLAGADIIELNTVRKHLSRLKGGQFAKLAEPANIYGFALSDVNGDRLDTIGSGLAVRDQTTSQAALDILRKYKVKVSNKIESAILEETPFNIRNAITKIIGNNELFCRIAAEKIMKKGYIPWLLTSEMQGEARHYSRMIPDIVQSARSSKSKINLPCIAICGGETTVKVQGSGKGGRNQEMALAAAIEIKNLRKVWVACIASDGKDGNSENCGAIVDTNSYNRLLSAGINPEGYLHNNDSATALNRIDATISQQDTQTNLNDLMLILIEKERY